MPGCHLGAARDVDGTTSSQIRRIGYSPSVTTLLRRAVESARRGADWARLTPLSRSVLRNHLTYLSPEKLLVIERLAKGTRQPGDFLECGMALGGSAIVMAGLRPDRTFHGYDVFGIIPPPSTNDPPEVHARYHTIVEGRAQGIGGKTYYGYLDSLYDEVIHNFAIHGVPVEAPRISLHCGLFEDTLFPEAPVALAHVDSDWHDPVKLCLERIWPRLSRGGHMVLDDYHDYGGCRQATDDFVAATPDATIVRSSPSAVLRRS